MINYNAALPAENYPASKSSINVTDWIQRVKGNLSYLIQQAFRGGEMGVFYDPLDTSTMYQESTGISPVSLTSQPLGLMLDKSKGLALGSELFNDSAVQLSGATKVSTGVYRINAPDSTSVSFGIPITGLRYKWVYLDFEVVRQGSGSARIDYGVGLSYAIPSVAGRYTVKLYCDRTDNAIVFIRSTWPTGIDIKINSVRFLAGNHAYQTSSAARPLFKQVPILGNEAVLQNLNGTVVPGNNGSMLISANNYAVGGKAYYITIPAGLKISNPNGWGQVSTGKPLVITANSNGTFAVLNSTASQITLNNLSIKEVLGYRTDRNYIEYDGVDDKLLTTFSAPLTNCTVVRAVPNEGTKILYNQTLPTSFEDTMNHSGFLAINRVLSNSEKVLLLNEMDKRTGITSMDSQVVRSFANNEVGVVYGLNDMSILYQDAAGTIPVTAVGQPVGLVLDKSKGLVVGGELNTMSWAATTPTWVVTNGIAKASAGSAGALYHLGANVGRFYKITVKITHLAGTLQVYTNSNLLFLITSGGTQTLTFYGFSSSAGNGRLVDFYAQSGFYGEVDLNTVTIKELSGNHAYQTVSASRPVLRKNDTTGAYYLEFDGVDDFLQTNNIDFTSTDKVSVFAGIVKLSNSQAYSCVTELSASVLTSNGVFNLIATGVSTGDGFLFENKGTTFRPVGVIANPVPYRAVITQKGDIVGGSTQLKLNGNLATINAGSLGTGNYGNYPLYIGRRGGTALPFNGHLYSLIIMGRLASDAETTVLENAIAKQVGVTL